MAQIAGTLQFDMTVRCDARGQPSAIRATSAMTNANWSNRCKRASDKRTVIMREIVNGLIYTVVSGGRSRKAAAALDVVRLFRPVELGWRGRSLHRKLYVKRREAIGREASPTAAVIDSQSVKSAEKGRLRLIRRATTRERSDNEDVALRSRVRSGIFSSIRESC
jgi:hypothetical protein